MRKFQNIQCDKEVKVDVAKLQTLFVIGDDCRPKRVSCGGPALADLLRNVFHSIATFPQCIDLAKGKHSDHPDRDGIWTFKCYCCYKTFKHQCNNGVELHVNSDDLHHAIAINASHVVCRLIITHPCYHNDGEQQSFTDNFNSEILHEHSRFSTKRTYIHQFHKDNPNRLTPKELAAVFSGSCYVC